MGTSIFDSFCGHAAPGSGQFLEVPSCQSFNVQWSKSGSSSDGRRRERQCRIDPKLSGGTRAGVHDRRNDTRTFKIGSTIVFPAGRRLDSIDETMRILCLTCNKPSPADCGNRASASAPRPATRPGVRSTFALTENLVHTGTRRFPQFRTAPSGGPVTT